MRIIKLLSICTFLTLSHCKTNDNGSLLTTYSFLLKNSTSKDVVLSIYYPNDIIFKSYNVASESKILLEEAIVDPVGGSLRLTNILDSAIFIFSDGKKLSQTFLSRGLSDTVNNVLSIIFYKEISNINYKKTLLFTLKEEDYLRAN